LRRLRVFSIVHTRPDLGSFANAADRLRPDPANAVQAFWDRLRELVLNLPVDWPQVIVYQDSLPICGFEGRLIRDLAAQGSPNFQLLEELAARGARVLGTESPELLKREYDLIRRPEGWTPGALGALAIERDDFIARRIDQTLPEGGEGLLFIGMLHDVADHLPDTIFVEHSEVPD
jgi:hypothetical protein